MPGVIPLADTMDVGGRPILNSLLADALISAEALIPHGEKLQATKVLRHSLDENGQVRRAFNDHTLMNILVYDVEFPDGTVNKYAANINAENMLSHVDPDSFYINIV